MQSQILVLDNIQTYKKDVFKLILDQWPTISQLCRFIKYGLSTAIVKVRERNI